MSTRRSLAAALGVLVIGAFAAGALAASGENDALTAARFSITIDGYEIASFSELQGITTGVDVVSRGDKPRPLPPTAVLKRGMSRSLELNAWHELVLLGDVAAARKDATLTIYDVEGKPVARYHLENAWPAKIEIGALKAGASEVLMETVTMTAEFIQRVSV